MERKKIFSQFFFLNTTSWHVEFAYRLRNIYFNVQNNRYLDKNIKFLHVYKENMNSS